MLEALLALVLYSAIPDVVFLPAALEGVYLFDKVNTEIQTEEAIQDKLTVYVKNYSEDLPEWGWGDKKGRFDFHEILGSSLENLEKYFIKSGLRKLEKGEKIPNDDYTLSLYFDENCCVKAEYLRPLDKQFLAKYGHNNSQNFHVYSELLGKEYPIDLNVYYYDFLNTCRGRAPQMCIKAGFCAEILPYVSYVRCHVSE